MLNHENSSWSELEKSLDMAPATLINILKHYKIKE